MDPTEPAAELEQLEGAELDQGGDLPGELVHTHGAELEQLAGEAIAELEHEGAQPAGESVGPGAASDGAGAGELEQLEQPAPAAAPAAPAAAGGGLLARARAQAAAEQAEREREERAELERAELERKQREQARANLRASQQTNSAPVRWGSVWAPEPQPPRGQVMQSRTTQLNANRGKGMSIERAYLDQWAQDKIDQTRWAQFFCAASTGAQSPEDITRAADLADYMYIELMRRQQGEKA